MIAAPGGRASASETRAQCRGWTRLGCEIPAMVGVRDRIAGRKEQTAPPAP